MGSTRPVAQHLLRQLRRDLVVPVRRQRQQGPEGRRYQQALVAPVGRRAPVDVTRSVHPALILLPSGAKHNEQLLSTLSLAVTRVSADLDMTPCRMTLGVSCLRELSVFDLGPGCFS